MIDGNTCVTCTTDVTDINVKLICFWMYIPITDRLHAKLFSTTAETRLYCFSAGIVQFEWSIRITTSVESAFYYWTGYGIFVPSDLDLWPLDLKFSPVVTLVQCCVSTKYEVSTAFIFQENRRHGTDGQTERRSVTLNAFPREGHIIKETQSSR